MKNQTIKYSDLSDDLKYTLHYSVVNYVLLNKRVVELKAKHFNHIPEISHDYDEYKFCDREAYFYLSEVKKIKNIKGEKGYHGKSGQDIARIYCHNNYKRFQQMLPNQIDNKGK